MLLSCVEDTIHEENHTAKSLSLISPRHRNSFRCFQALLYSVTQSFSTKSFKPIDPEPQSSPIISPLRQTLSCYANDWKRALEFFNWVQTQSGFNHPTDTSYNRMIDILSKFFEFYLVWVLIQRMKARPSCVPQPCHFVHRVQALCSGAFS